VRHRRQVAPPPSSIGPGRAGAPSLLGPAAPVKAGVSAAAWPSAHRLARKYFHTIQAPRCFGGPNGQAPGPAWKRGVPGASSAGAAVRSSAGERAPCAPQIKGIQNSYHLQRNAVAPFTTARHRVHLPGVPVLATGPSSRPSKRRSSTHKHAGRPSRNGRQGERRRGQDGEAMGGKRGAGLARAGHTRRQRGVAPHCTRMHAWPI
jgi:hypothetical protein